VDLGGSYGTVNDSFAGIALPDTFAMTGFAFGRDNIGTYGDRIAGTMYLQYTTVSGTENISQTGADYDINWTTFGSITTTDRYDHVFSFASPINMTGLRIVTQAGNCIDEIQLYGDIAAAPLQSAADGDWNTADTWNPAVVLLVRVRVIVVTLAITIVPAARVGERHDACYQSHAGRSHPLRRAAPTPACARRPGAGAVRRQRVALL
jgi:hypothetical protein